MARKQVTSKRARQYLSLYESMLAGDGLTDDLRAHYERRAAFYRGRLANCCKKCGARLVKKASIEAWKVDGLGPECREVVGARSS